MRLILTQRWSGESAHRQAGGRNAEQPSFTDYRPPRSEYPSNPGRTGSHRLSDDRGHRNIWFRLLHYRKRVADLNGRLASQDRLLTEYWTKLTEAETQIEQLPLQTNSDPSRWR